MLKDIEQQLTLEIEAQIAYYIYILIKNLINLKNVYGPNCQFGRI